MRLRRLLFVCALGLCAAAESPARQGPASGAARRDWRLPALLVAVFLLLVNDFILKAALGNWWTGKLSDVAGLFAFALFWSLLFPHRRWWIAGITAMGFVFWKSPASQPLIDGINRLAPFPVGRVVDWTDCLALAVLPAAAVLAARGARWSLRRVRDLGVAGLSLFAFAATETLPPEDVFWESFTYDESYHLDAPREEVVFELAEIGASVDVHQLGVNVDHRFSWHDCFVDSHSELEEGDSVSSTLRLYVMSQSCEEERGDDADALRTVYEDSLVTPLRQRLAP